MDEIRPWLFIGKYADTLDKNTLDLQAIKAMLQLAGKVEHAGIATLYLPVQDLAPVREEWIQQGVDFIKEQHRNQNKLLIACGAGINRSTAFCMIALKEVEGLGLWDAYREIKQRHPASFPHEPVWYSLCHYYNEKIPYLDVIRFNP